MKSALSVGIACVLVIACTLVSAQSLNPSAASSAKPLATIEVPDSAIVAERGGHSITVGDLRAKLRSTLGEQKRRGFFSDGQSVARLIDNLLVTRQLVDEARAAGLDKDPLVQAEIEAVTLDLLARRQAESYMRSLEEPDFEILAKERYTANKDGYAVPESRDVRHILIRKDDHSEAEAYALATKVHDLLASGADFDKVFKEYSEDSAKELNGWVRDVRDGGDYDPDFTDAAFSLHEVGELTPPVMTSFGYHIIRLEHVTPKRPRSYDEVKDEIIQKVRSEFRETARAAYIQKFTSEPLHFNDETMKLLPNASPESPTASSTR